MKILTWNMGYPFHRDKHQEAWDYLVNVLDPDIALLQETVPSDELEESGRVLWKVAKGTSFGSAIYLKSGELIPVKFGSYSGRVIAAEINELGLLLISIHAPIDEAGYIMPNLYPIFDSVRTVVKDKRFIVGGDLNASRLWDDVHGTTHHTEFFDSVESDGFYNCTWSYFGREIQTFYGKRAKNAYQNDHLFIDVSSKYKMKSCEVLKYEEPLSLYSDHVPVGIKIKI